MKRTMNGWGHCFFPVAVLLMGLIGLVGCKGGHEKPPVPASLPAVQVRVQKVAEEQLGSRIEVVGTVQAVERAAIAARLSGQIIEMPVVLGSQVQQGDLLVRMSAAEISARLLQARGQVDLVNRNLAREERLLQQNASTAETVKGLRDQARIAEAARKEAESMAQYVTITAPFAGTITRKVASVGDLASPGVILLEMENPLALQVVAQVPEALVLALQKGDRLPVSVPAAAVNTEGEVAEVAPATDPATRTAPVKINIASAPNLRAGQFARVALVSAAGAKALVVGETAVLPFGQMERVFVVEDNTARLRLVRTGAHREGRVEILAGLNAGDQVVVGGQEQVQDGQAVLVSLEEQPRGEQP